MKFLVIAVLALSAFSAFGYDVASTIANIEAEKGVKCRKSGSSSMQFCSADYYTGTCTYTSKYKCGRQEVKLRVIESYNPETRERENRVKSVTYL